MNYTDDVRGQIVGGNRPTVMGQLFNNSGIAQNFHPFEGETEKEVTEQASAYYNEHGGKLIWPNGLELRLY